MFIDHAKVKVESGAGGNGVVAWRREKYVPHGGPAGGDGGVGGSVYLEASSNLQTLLDFKHQSVFRAGRGENGGSKNCHGKNGADTVIKVPCGTVVKDADSGLAIADLTEAGQRVLVAQGGRGGRGNARFVSSRKQAPHFAEPGEPSIVRELDLELKLIADVGLNGMPNAGKSTLISVLSAAKPKIADYPFTTLVPNLGVLRRPDGDGVVLADIPGLIEGASEGVGLGHDFLRHVERTRLLLHLVDISAPEVQDPLESYRTINRELQRYSERLSKKPQLLVLTKADTVLEQETRHWKTVFEKESGRPVWVISAVARQGLSELTQAMLKTLDSVPVEETAIEVVPDLKATDNDDSAFYVEPVEPGVFQVVGGKVERFMQVTDMRNSQAVYRLAKIYESMGVYKALAQAGAEYGDTVVVGKTEFQYLPIEREAEEAWLQEEEAL